MTKTAVICEWCIKKNCLKLSLHQIPFLASKMKRNTLFCDVIPTSLSSSTKRFVAVNNVIACSCLLFFLYT